MALPPSIPTSFVPKQPISPQQRKRPTGMNLLLIIGLAVFGLAAILAAGVYGYSFYLKNALAAKQAELAEAQRSIDATAVEDFIRLRDRLSSVETLLDRHVLLSRFFAVLEARTLESVRFTSLTVTVLDDRTAEISMTGAARSFNALAAQSAELAGERLIRRAIFSDIAATEEGTVGFTLTAVLDSRLVTEAPLLPGTPLPESPVPAAPASAEGADPQADVPAATGTPPAATSSPVL